MCDDVVSHVGESEKRRGRCSVVRVFELEYEGVYVFCRVLRGYSGLFKFDLMENEKQKWHKSSQGNCLGKKSRCEKI